MKATRKRYLTENEVRELFDYYNKPETDRISDSEARNRKMLKHFQFSLLALTGTSS